MKQPWQGNFDKQENDYKCYSAVSASLRENFKQMKIISLKIDDSIFGDTEKILSKIKKPRNRYINEAIDHYNRLQRRSILEKMLKKESELVQSDSMSVLKDFEEIDYVD